MFIYKSLVSLSLIFSLFPHSCYAVKKKGQVEKDPSTPSQITRSKSFSDARRIFTSNEDKDKVKHKNQETRIKQSHDDETLNVLESPKAKNDKWVNRNKDESHLSLATESRAKSLKKKLNNGENPEVVQLNSKDWLTRNTIRCLKFRQLQNTNSKEAQEFILLAHNDGYPAATLEFVKQSLARKELHKSKFFFRKACENFILYYEKFDKQAREVLVEAFERLADAKKNGSLNKIFNEEFKNHPCFERTKKETSKVEYDENTELLLDKFTEKGRLSENFEDEFSQLVLKLKQNKEKEDAQASEENIFSSEEFE